METYYALGCIFEGIIILCLVGLIVSQRITIVRYQEDYLDRQYGFARRYIKTGAD